MANSRRSVVVDLEIRNRQARKALQGVESGMTRLSQKTQKSTAAMSQGFNRASQNVQGSTVAVSNLSRIVEDAPFGVRGVANNINPFIQSFQSMGDEATTTGQKFKMLLSSAFTGPGALLTISALITSAMTAIQMGLFDWGDEAESVDESMEKLLGTLDEFIDEQAQMGGDNIFDPLGQATTQQKLSQVRELREELDELFSLRNQAEDLRQKIADVNAEIAGRGGLQPGSSQLGSTAGLGELGNELMDINTQIAKQEKLFGELSEAEEKDIKAKLDDLVATEKLNAAFLRLNPVMQRQLTLNQELRPLLRDIELGLSGAREELEELVGSYENIIDTLRLQIESGEIHGEQLETLKELMMAYKESVDQAKKALDGLGDTQEQVNNFEGRFGMRQFQRRRQQSIPGEAPEDTVVEADMFNFDNMQTEVDKMIAANNRLFMSWEKIELSSKEAGETGQQSLQATTAAANMLGNALAQAVIRGEALEGVLKSLAAQLASRAIITGLGALLTGGASLGGGSFLEAMFGGFAHGTDAGFPGMGMVGERGKELLVAPPMSSIITNENVERMDRMRKEARQGADNLSGINGSQLISGIRAAMFEAVQALPPPRVNIEHIDEELVDLSKVQTLIGNG